jgi:purine-binding chemotaxis protein CheW
MNEPNAASASEQFLTFEIASQLFAVPILAVQEIRGWDKIAHVPRTPAHVLGVIDLRGAVVPVLDVRTRLGLPTREQTATTVVVIVQIEMAGVPTTVGCVVDAVSDVITLDIEQIRRAPDTCGSVDSHFVRGVAATPAGLIMLLETQRLIGQPMLMAAVA